MPSDDRLASEAGWCEAVEIFPDIVADREILTTYVINIDVEPAQIVWGKRGVEVDERKSSLEEITKAKFKAVVDAEVAKEPTRIPRRSMTLPWSTLRGSCSRHGWTRLLLPRPTRTLTH
jgi:hypothetical protein